MHISGVNHCCGSAFLNRFGNIFLVLLAAEFVPQFSESIPKSSQKIRKDSALAVGTAYHNPLLLGSAFGILAPFIRLKVDVLIDFLDFLLCCPTCRSVLTVSDCLVLDVVEVISVGK